MESFKFKLAAYFSLISLLPLAAAFWGFDAVTQSAETGRADSVLQMGLRASLATYRDHLSRLEAPPSAWRAIARSSEPSPTATRYAYAAPSRGSPHFAWKPRACGSARRGASPLERSVDRRRPERPARPRRRGRCRSTAALTKTLAIHSGLTQAAPPARVPSRRRASSRARRLSGSSTWRPATREPCSLGSTRYRLLASEALPTPRESAWRS